VSEFKAFTSKPTGITSMVFDNIGVRFVYQCYCCYGLPANCKETVCARGTSMELCGSGITPTALSCSSCWKRFCA
jgi:hypothetical protein